MCTRYFIEPDTEEFRDIIAAAEKSRLANAFRKAGNAVLTSGEIRPTNVVPVIATGKSGRKAVFPMKWGFRIPNGPLVVNARSETAARKTSFREAWKSHRCVIPASWYFEWEHLLGAGGKKKTGAKYLIQPRGAGMTWLAGLYRLEDDLPVFTVLTREPADELRRIHDRMPLMLPEDLVDRWIRPETKPEELLSYALTDVIAEKTGEDGETLLSGRNYDAGR